MTPDTARVTAWVEELAKAHAAATPGPWTAATAPAEGSDETAAEYLTAALRPDEGRPLWVAWAQKVDALHTDCDYVVPVVTGDGPASEANAKYLASVHAALPALLAVVRGVAELADFVDECAEGRSPLPAAAYRDIADRLRRLLADAAPDGTSR